MMRSSTTPTASSGAPTRSAAGLPKSWSTPTLEVIEVLEHQGETIVRGRYDGEYDKTNLPDEVILTNYFTVRDGKIVSLIVIRNSPAY